MPMAWIRLDTNMPTHEKIIRLAGYGDRGLAAAFVYVSSLSHSGGHETSGFIAKGALPFIHGKASHAKLLVEVRLWDPVDGGWQIHNWGDRNVVAATQQAISEARSQAGRRGAEARWHPDEPMANANGKAMANDATYERTDVRTNERPPRPAEISPVPDRARGNRTEARREIEELARTRTAATS